MLIILVAMETVMSLAQECSMTSKNTVYIAWLEIYSMAHSLGMGGVGALYGDYCVGTIWA